MFFSLRLYIVIKFIRSVYNMHRYIAYILKIDNILQQQHILQLNEVSLQVISMNVSRTWFTFECHATHSLDEMCPKKLDSLRMQRQVNRQILG